jgi:hypothetical protein
VHVPCCCWSPAATGWHRRTTACLSAYLAQRGQSRWSVSAARCGQYRYEDWIIIVTRRICVYTFRIDSRSYFFDADSVWIIVISPSHRAYVGYRVDGNNTSWAFPANLSVCSPIRNLAGRTAYRFI